jgi:hypothetical protein
VKRVYRTGKTARINLSNNTSQQQTDAIFFLKNDIEASLKALQEKISIELKALPAEDMSSALFAYIRNVFVLLSQDEDSPFFKTKVRKLDTNNFVKSKSDNEPEAEDGRLAAENDVTLEEAPYLLFFC